MLFERSVSVLPDILANAGGVAVSYDGWGQNHGNAQWGEETGNAELIRKMERATDPAPT